MEKYPRNPLDEDDKMKKVYVDNSNQVKITCPKCGLEQNKNVFKFKNTQKRLKATCKCGEVFRFSLDFRRYHRKDVQLSGEYFVRENGEKDDIFIKDISMTGINFTTFKPHNFSIDDTVELKITLDTPIEMETQATVKIKWAVGRNVGAQFNNPKSLEKDLSIYMSK